MTEFQVYGTITNESARGVNKYTGSGDINKLFYLFIPENMSNGDREIKLILQGTGSSTASTTKILLQKNPNWTAGGFGWEVVDDAEAGKYGFKWTRKVAYLYPYTKVQKSTVVDHCQGIIDTYGASANGFATVGSAWDSDWNPESGLGNISLGYRAWILLDYTKLNNITGASSSSDGYNNTLALYNHSGTTASSQFEIVLTTMMKTESGKETENMFRLPGEYETKRGVSAESGQDNDLSAIMEYVQKKNRYYLQKRTVSGDSSGNAYAPYFRSEDLKWYLPAYDQFQYFTPDPNIPGDNKANYWSSTAVDGASEAYIGDGTAKDRDLEYRVIAVRRDENGYGNATAQVDNSSMAGGENGSTNNWLQ